MPEPYPEEILYSWHSRYHGLIENTATYDTSKELFGIIGINPNVNYPVNLGYFCEQLPSSWKYNINYLINMFTLFPVFKPFMKIERAIKCIVKMTGGDSRQLEGLMGVHAGDLFQSRQYTIKICTDCYMEDIHNYRRAYIHRIHQVPGNFVCPTHKKYLSKCMVPDSFSTKSFININNFEIDNNDYGNPNDLLDSLVVLGNEVELLLNGYLEKFSIDLIQEKYFIRLNELGYCALNGRIKNNALINDFLNHYPRMLLEKLQSYIDNTQRKNWISKITSRNEHLVHPIRHLLFIRFLFGTLEKFVSYNGRVKVFGDGPWPCLNSVASHYKELVVKECKVSYPKKLSTPVGEFKCLCGFIYLKVYKENNMDIFKIGQIKEYGQTWDNYLINLIKNKYNITDMVKLMKSSRRTIIKHSKRLGLEAELSNHKVLDFQVKIVNKRMVNQDNYKKTLLDFIAENPDTIREVIRRALPREYNFLISKHREWFEKVMPRPFRYGHDFYGKSNDINWKHDDEEISKLVILAATGILQEYPLRKITKAYIIKIIDCGTLSLKVLSKLPLTKASLERVTETKEDFYKRTNLTDDKRNG